MDSDKIGTCQHCHKVTTGLRKQLCRACYLRLWRGAELPQRAACMLCEEQRHAVLRWTKVGEDRVVLCQNCGFLADRLRPRAESRDELNTRLRRERRNVIDRRHNYIISDDESERRQGSRRRRRASP